MFNLKKLETLTEQWLEQAKRIVDRLEGIEKAMWASVALQKQEQDEQDRKNDDDELLTIHRDDG